jgi:hypothetical protein
MPRDLGGHPIANTWRERARELARWSDPTAAVWSYAADELEGYELERQLEALTLEEASIESDYSKSHLARLLSTGSLPNAGTRGAPRILRRDLPRKPPRSKDKARSIEPDLVSQALEAAGITSV